MRYIVIEGVDNTGKTLIVKELSKRILNNFTVEEPSKNLFNGKLRDIILNNNMNSRTRQLLLLASREQSLTEEVFIHEKEDKYNKTNSMVISDRNYLSQLVYCKDEDYDLVFKENYKYMNDYKPDLIFVISVNIDTIVERTINSKELNKLDSLNIEIIADRIDKYDHMSKIMGSICQIDGNGTIDEIVNDIIKVLLKEKIIEKTIIKNKEYYRCVD